MTVIEPPETTEDWVAWRARVNEKLLLLMFAAGVLFLAASSSAQTQSPRAKVTQAIEKLTDCVRERGAEACMDELKQFEIQVSPKHVRLEPRIEARARQLGEEGTFCALLKVSTLRPPIPRNATMDAVLSCIEAILDGRWDEAAATEDVTARIQRTGHVPTELEMELSRQAVRQAVMRFSQDAGACTADGWFEADDTWKLADDCFRSTVAELRRAAVPP